MASSMRKATGWCILDGFCFPWWCRWNVAGATSVLYLIAMLDLMYYMLKLGGISTCGIQQLINHQAGQCTTLIDVLYIMTTPCEELSASADDQCWRWLVNEPRVTRCCAVQPNPETHRWSPAHMAGVL
jgi:hypothetical protein